MVEPVDPGVDAVEAFQDLQLKIAASGRMLAVVLQPHLLNTSAVVEMMVYYC